MNEIVTQYFEKEDIQNIKEYGNGHINDTFLVKMKTGERYILQKINHHVFQRPEDVMENIVNVTRYLRKKIAEGGGNPRRETLTVVLTKDGASYCLDGQRAYWRAYEYIEDTICYEKSDTPEVLYHVGISFGNFQKMLSEFSGENLHEVIPNFHNTKMRYQTFIHAIENDSYQRADSVKNEIAFLEKRKKYAVYFNQLLEKKLLPIRVTHNDTKINNILMDQKTGRGVCVIDLDTVMPGIVAYDFGDAIRSGARCIIESENDDTKVHFDLKKYEMFVKGFLEALEGALTENEINSLAMGAKIITYEQGIRYLTDYLQGDIYFKTHYEGENLVRCRNQLSLLREMEDNWEEMCQIIKKYK